MSTARNFLALWLMSRAARRGYKSVQAKSTGESLKHAGIAWGQTEIAQRLTQERKTDKSNMATSGGGAGTTFIAYLIAVVFLIIVYMAKG